MSKTLSYSENRIGLAGVHRILPEKIRNAIETPHGIVVLFEYDRMKKQNVVLLDDQLNQLWQIEDINPAMPICPYSFVAYEQGKLKAYNVIGVDCEIDLSSGKIINAVFTK